MKVYLMHQGTDVDFRSDAPPHAPVLSADIGLDDVCRAMAQGDDLIHTVSWRALVRGLRDNDAIVYRQQVLSDFLARPGLLGQMYQIATEALVAEHDVWGVHTLSPRPVLNRGIKVCRLFLSFLRRLRRLSDEHLDQSSSQGLVRLFKMIKEELSDEYFAKSQYHLRQLDFPKGFLISGGLGPGNTGRAYQLHEQADKGWRQRLRPPGRGAYSFEILPRDQAGGRALDDIEGRAISSVANAVAQSAEHIRSFFATLQAELAFYMGCVNLHATLIGLGHAICWPQVTSTHDLDLCANRLYDIGLALRTSTRVVDNSFDANGKSLVVVTGANQGGKSTFLRSIGLAQLMMQSGMFVAATAFRANICAGVFTHFKQGEDKGMESGKLDEELRRLSDIADLIAPSSMLLCNESFASTNEREGSQLGDEVIRAVIAAGVKVVFVTHLFELADSLFRERGQRTLFLCAPRQSDQERFRLVQGRPERTAYGEDAFHRVFGERLGR